MLSNEVELYTDFCKYIFLKLRSFRRKLRSRCSRLPDKRLSQEEQSSFKESKVGSFFCCIRQIKPRNKKNTCTLQYPRGENNAQTIYNRRKTESYCNVPKRSTKIFISYDTVIPAVSYEYFTSQKNADSFHGLWYAITSNKVTFDSDDDSVIQTVLQIDGLGRAVRTAKQDFSTALTAGMQVAPLNTMKKAEP